MERWCRMAVVFDDGVAARTWVLKGRGPPDLRAVDAVARRALWAWRAGGRLVLSDVAPELSELLELAALPVEVEGQAKRREEALGVDEVEEEGHLDDPAP